MSKNLENVMGNLKQYIESNFKIKLAEESIKVDNGIFGLNYEKNEVEKQKEKESIDWFQNIKIYKETINYSFFDEKIMFLKHEKKKEYYMLYSSSDDIKYDSDVSEDLKEFLENMELDLGVFLSLFEKEEYYPFLNSVSTKMDVGEIMDISYDSDMQNHDFKDILKVFSPIYFFRIKKDYANDMFESEEEEDKHSATDSFTFRVLGLIKTNNKIKGINKQRYLEDETINLYRETFLKEINYFPYENLYLSLSHNSSKYIFLEIYRIIEKLYPIIYCHSIKCKLKLTEENLFQIREIFEDDLNWRHKEEDALKKIFEYINQYPENKEYINELEAYKEKCAKGVNLASWIYQIRNTSVHLSFDDKKSLNLLEILNKNNILIKNLMHLIGNTYYNLFDR